MIKTGVQRGSAEVQMLKIGEFSRLSQVTVKTLHHYDDIGLFKPSHIDPFTSYRYYTLDQLPRIHGIMALKAMGLSLEEILLLLADDAAPEQLCAVLRVKHAEAQQRVREEQARLAHIEFRLRQIELEGSMDTLAIVIKRIEPLWVLSLRRDYRSRAEREVFGTAMDKAVREGLIKWTGAAPVNIFYEEEFRGDYLDTENCVPVEADHTPSVSLGEAGTVTLRQLPAIERAATFMHQGDYDSLPEKYLLLQRWAVENGYKLGGVWRFVYHRGPMHNADPSEYLTELQHPIEQAD